TQTFTWETSTNGTTWQAYTGAVNATTGSLTSISDTLWGTSQFRVTIKTVDVLSGETIFNPVEIGVPSASKNSTQSYQVTAPMAPIAIDLNNNGVQYLSRSAGVSHDYDGDGIAQATAWVAAEDGLLANQRTDGSLNVVFSTQAGETDLEGLTKVYDSNRDSVFDAADAGFNGFGVWQDANSDGMLQEGEFKSLADWGIVSLSLTSDGVLSSAADGDVTVFGKTTYTMTDGSTGIAEDVAFAVSSVNYTDSNGVVDVYHIASIEAGKANIDRFSMDDGDRLDLSSILSSDDAVRSTISIDQDATTDSYSTITVNIGGIDYDVATLYGKEMGISDALGGDLAGVSARDSLNGASWTDIVDISSDNGGPASIFADGGALTNTYSNEAGDWTVQIKSGTATVDAANKQINFTSDQMENSAVITTADGTAHEITNVDKILWH
ncbi:MAG: hypothetical protein U1D69_11390, partial [Polynucleobacter sp.]|nr:hypothetical protein [Polynucleobacter sp.]